MGKQIFKIFILSAVFFILPSFTKAAVIFEDNFDNSPDWQSAENFSPASNATWPNTWKDKPGGPSQPPPQNWTAYSAGIPYSDRGPTWQLNSSNARSGKGITYTFDAIDYWSGGGLDLYLGNTGYQELYMRGFYRYDPVTFHWPTISNGGINNGSIQKIARISRYQLEPSLTNNPQQFLSPSYQAPTFYPDVGANTGTGYQNPPTYNAVHLIGLRVLDPGAGNALNEDFYSFSIPTDGQWHSYEFRVKMNSSPGVADGEWEVWVDGGANPYQHHLRSGIPWVAADSANGLTPGWNWISAMDNILVNQAGTIYENTPMKIFMDDFVVSTNYIGPDYVIGNSDSTAPAAPTGLNVQ